MQDRCAGKLVDKYIDDYGKARFVGNDQLKGSQ